LEPGVVGRDRAVWIQADRAAAEVSGDVRIVQKVALDAVYVGVVEAERVGAGDDQRAVGREQDTPLDAALDQYIDVLEPERVLAEPGTPDALSSDAEDAPLGKRQSPNVLVQMLGRPHAARFALPRREVGEI